MKSLTVSALAAVMAAAAGGFAATTDGFVAFTTEGARRISVERDPRPLPDIQLEDQDGRVVSLNDWGGRVMLTEFIYTRCPTICSELGQAFARTAELLHQPLASGDLVMLSISFDLRHDTVAELAEYGRRHGADGTGWRIVRPRSEEDLQALLARFGVVVIPDGEGGFAHNAAIQIVDRSGRLVRVIDYVPVEAAVGLVQPWLNG